MTRGDIIRMAREAGFAMENSAAIQAAERFAALVAAAEREVCWRTAENYDTGSEAAAAIRARSQQ